MAEVNDVRAYYDKFFPLDDIEEWIQHKIDGEPEPLDRRECAVYFDGEKFWRWITIDRVRRLVKPEIGSNTPPPERIEIGPVYNLPISVRRSGGGDQLRAERRELVFDIDADDFKDIKCCCGESEICERCWPYMACALECLIKALTENFGFKRILPVFSGRRGVHIWVCDARARTLTAPVREKIVKYLDLRALSGDKLGKCPLAKSMIATCERYFADIMIEQNIFTNEKIRRIVEEIVNGDTLKEIRNILATVKGTNQEKLRQIKNLKRGDRDFSAGTEYPRLLFTFTFPRLDANVTTILNHLLKTPFSFHPKSGLLSVPIPKERRDQLPRTWVPSLTDLVHGDSDAAREYSRAVHDFQEFVKGGGGYV